MTGKPGAAGSLLGSMIFAVGGPDGPKVIGLRAESLLWPAHLAVFEAQFAPHAPPAWVLGGIDSRLGERLLAFSGADAPQPLSGAITGLLGTANSLLGNMRPALGDEEGESNASFINVSAESTLSLAQSADRQAVFARTVSSALSVGHAVLLTSVLNVAADSTLALAHDAIGTLGGIHNFSVESTLELGQAVGTASVLSLSTESLLTLGQDVVEANGHEYNIDTGSVLDIQQDCGMSHAFDAAASSPLSLSQIEAVSRPWHLSAQSVLQDIHVEFSPETLGLVEIAVGLNSTADATRPWSPSVGNVIPLRQTAAVVRAKPTAINLSAGSTIELADEVDKNQATSASTWLTLFETAAADICKPLQSELELTSEAATSAVRRLIADSALTLAQSVTFSILKEGVQYQYHPFIGEGVPDAPLPPPATLTGPLEGVTAPFQLQYPAIGDVIDSIILRAPDFGNKDRLSFNRVLRETRGGTLVVYADPIWPRIQTLVLNFSGLPGEKARKLLDFLDDHLGEEIGLMDWEHRYWRGVVTVPDDPLVQDGLDSFAASVEFEGELVSA
jgi:hypothetical protein